MSDLETSLTRRAARAYAHAAQRRAEAWVDDRSAKVRARLERAERHQRRAYLEALRLADLEA